MVFNTSFNNISVISWQSVYWWRKPEFLEKTTDLSQVTDKLSHNVVSSTPAWAGFEPTTLVVTGSDYIDSYKSNYHTIWITTAFKASPCESFDQVISIWYLFLIFYIMAREQVTLDEMMMMSALY